MALRPIGGPASGTPAPGGSSTEFTILYPGGTAQAPGDIQAAARVVVTNPYPGSAVIARVEVKAYDMWGDPGFTFNSQSFQGYGLKVSQAEAADGSFGDLVLQAGSAALLAPAGYTGSPFNSATGSESFLQFRVLVWKL